MIILLKIKDANKNAFVLIGWKWIYGVSELETESDIDNYCKWHVTFCPAQCHIFSKKQPMDHGDDENGEHQAYFSCNKPTKNAKGYKVGFNQNLKIWKPTGNSSISEYISEESWWQFTYKSNCTLLFDSFHFSI